jgi:hypothetical protein
MQAILIDEVLLDETQYRLSKGNLIERVRRVLRQEQQEMACSPRQTLSRPTWVGAEDIGYMVDWNYDS